MAHSTTNLDLISSSQSGKEVTANALLDAASPATLFGRRASTTTGLTWGYYGGALMVDGAPATIVNGTIALTASASNYIECDRAGVVSKNTTAFTPGRIPLYVATTGPSSVTAYFDQRLAQPKVTGRFARTMTDANYTLLYGDAGADILEFTGGTLTATRSIVVPLAPKQWTVYNGTGGGQSLQFIGATGTGITIANAKRAIIYADGTNVVRVTADT